MRLRDVDWAARLAIHDVIVPIVNMGHESPIGWEPFRIGRGPRLMWRGYGRFTNLDGGSEWFVKDSEYEFLGWERAL